MKNILIYMYIHIKKYLGKDSFKNSYIETDRTDFPPRIICPASALKIAPLNYTQLSDVNPENIIHPRLISVVIPVKDNQLGILNFLNSFVANTNETDYPLEVIIVDNNSSPPLELNAENYPIPLKLVVCHTKGPAAARNMGVRHSKGKWILFTDSDCEATPNFISGYCKDDNTCVAYAGSVILPDSDPLTRYYREENILVPLALSNQTGGEPWSVVTANCLVLKSAFDAVGGFNEKFKSAGGEDTELGLRLRLIGRIEYNWESESIHRFEDGIDGFINRFIRYGQGNKTMEELYGISFYPNKPRPRNQTSESLILAKIHGEAMLHGYKGKESSTFPRNKTFKKWKRIVEPKKS